MHTFCDNLVITSKEEEVHFEGASLITFLKSNFVLKKILWSGGKYIWWRPLPLMIRCLHANNEVLNFTKLRIDLIS